MRGKRFRLVLVLVTALAATTTASQRSPDASADAIFFNGKVVTVDDRFSIAQAFAVKGDIFVAVGTNQRIRSLAGKTTRQLDLRGRTVIPGLGDNHNHLYDSAKIMLRGLSLEGVVPLRGLSIAFVRRSRRRDRTRPCSPAFSGYQRTREPNSRFVNWIRSRRPSP